MSGLGVRSVVVAYLREPRERFWGVIRSLDVTSFENATGGGFLDPTVEPIPEPRLAALLAVALGTLGARRRRPAA